MPILQNFNLVTVQVTTYPGPLIAQHKRAQAPTKIRQPYRCAGPRNQATAEKKKKNQSNIKYRVEKTQNLLTKQFK
jgi:hypothetical protein